MKSFQVFIATALLLTVVNGCSGSGRQNIAGRQCPQNWAPIDLKLKADQKLWQKGQNESSLTPGKYIYQQADLIYTEKGEKGSVVHIQDVAERGVFKPRVYCVRNGLNLTNKNISVAANVVSQMISKAGVTSDVEGKELSFKTTDRRLVAESKALPKPDSLSKVYEGKADDLFMIDALSNQTDYEIRSTFSDNNGSYIVSVKLKRVNNP